MQNIIYKITEKNNVEKNNVEDNDSIFHVGIDEIMYKNYSKNQLNYILQYYKISQGRMSKDEIIQTIILYESDENNINIVNHRKYLWNMYIQIKNDEFFNKYLVINI
tara:strand:+ start:34381 stop:34701 length:321 start_codon:yes stop_codon:yes gene_type:complete